MNTPQQPDTDDTMALVDASAAGRRVSGIQPPEAGGYLADRPIRSKEQEKGLAKIKSALGRLGLVAVAGGLLLFTADKWLDAAESQQQENEQVQQEMEQPLEHPDLP